MTQSSIQEMQNFISEYKRFLQSKQKERLSILKQFIQFYADYRMEALKKRKITFNIMTLLNIGTDEVKHSRIVAWLFDENESHAQGNLFLKAFAKSFLSGFPEENPSKYSVRYEFSGCYSIIDIMICKQKEYLIYIENKIFSREGAKQLQRELADLRIIGKSLRVPEEHQYPIFLTPEGRLPISGNPKLWIPISYNKIITLVRSVLPLIKDEKLTYFLKDWIDAILNFGV